MSEDYGTKVKVGDRVVVAWHQREYAGTVTHTSRLGCNVKLDHPMPDGETELWRHNFEVYEVFSDPKSPSNRGSL